MTELERRALLGDKDAQKECTEKGIVLPCPCCGGTAKLKKGFPSRQIAHCRQAVVQCKNCGIRTVTHRQLPMEKWQDVDRAALEEWNTRPSPPIGRCRECKHHKGTMECWCHAADVLGTPSFFKNDGYCNHFEPKEDYCE